VKAIVIGGGIGGLTVAIALTRVGIDAQVYERAPVLREVGAGIGLSGNALRVLDGLGLGTAVRSQSIEGIQGGLRNIKGNILFAIPADEFTRQLGVVAVLHRAELLALLTQQVDPGRIHLGREFVGLEQDDKGVTARFENGETAHGHVLVGADGVKSAVRTQLIGERPPRYAGYTAWRSVVESDHSRNLNIIETWGRGRRFGIVPMSCGRIYWFATNNAPEGERDPAGRSRQILSNLFRGWHEPIEALIESANEDSILRNDIYDLDPLQRWVHDRVALLGDAAHPMTPNLGQGACQAIEDAVVLAACLCKSERVDSALAEYQRRRVPRASQFVLRSRLLGSVAQCSNPVLCWMRDTATRLTPRWVAARQLKSPLGFDLLTPSERILFQNQLHDGAY
jgi:2-polyprenyl-6-methoxyphenol hydroxylase-like FAD-dependent oxidoreductase